MKLLEYQAMRDASQFAIWFNGLDAVVAAKVSVAMVRMEKRNFSNAKSVGAGVQDFRINFRAGDRIYIGNDGDQIIILLAGGTKKRQQKGIDTANVG